MNRLSVLMSSFASFAPWRWQVPDLIDFHVHALDLPAVRDLEGLGAAERTGKDILDVLDAEFFFAVVADSAYSHWFDDDPGLFGNRRGLGCIEWEQECVW